MFWSNYGGGKQYEPCGLLKDLARVAEKRSICTPFTGDFLIIYSLVGLDLFSINDEKKPEKATVGWVVWGIAFVLLANFFIGPEQEQIQVKRRYARLTNR